MLHEQSSKNLNQDTRKLKCNRYVVSQWHYCPLGNTKKAKTDPISLGIV